MLYPPTFCKSVEIEIHANSVVSSTAQECLTHEEVIYVVPVFTKALLLPSTAQYLGNRLKVLINITRNILILW